MGPLNVRLRWLKRRGVGGVANRMGAKFTNPSYKGNNRYTPDVFLRRMLLGVKRGRGRANPAVAQRVVRNAKTGISHFLSLLFWQP